MSSFTDYFWGEKNNGFDVLYHNMKHGQTSSKELGDFLKESCGVEETYAKSLAKLAKFSGNCGTQGSFGPYWQVWKALVEKLSNLHLQLVHSWQELIKDVHKYTEEQHKKHKAMKDSESSTLEIVTSIQQITCSLQKAKELYHSRRLEYEKLKRETPSVKELEKSEAKYKKANDEYKSLVDKYANVRNEFEKKMTESCQKFQEMEVKHLVQMKDFVNIYAKSWENQHILVGQLHDEFRKNSDELTVDKLIETLVHSKTTGVDKPGPIEFEEPDLSNLPNQTSSADNSMKDFPMLEKPSKGTGFLSKNRKDKKKEKKKKKKGEEKEEVEEQNQPKVDEEGYSVRPDNPQGHDDNWYSSSDSDSDSDDGKRKIKVEIRPINANGNTASDNTMELLKTAGGLRLSPTVNRRTPTNFTVDSVGMKKSQSESESIGLGGKSSSKDLLGLDDWFVPSSTTTGTSQVPPLLSSNTPPPGNRGDLLSGTNTNTVSNSGLNEDLFGSNNLTEVPPALPTKQRPGASTPTGLPLFPAPPPGRITPRNLPSKHATARPTGRVSPASNRMDRADSMSSLDRQFTTTSMPVGSSRGPSPLTIGMSDMVPLAVAFSETANAFFKGDNEASCRVKMTGDLMISFPSGIVRVLTENPSPATLSFRVKNISNLEQTLVNKQLVVQDHSQSTSECLVYSFDMGALTDHLKKQAEVNRAASYFNIDILKYQIKEKPGSTGTPMHLVSHWKSGAGAINFILDYKYNGAALADRLPLSNIQVQVPVDGEVTNMQSSPTGKWSIENKRAVWRLPDLSEMSESGSEGRVSAKFDLTGEPKAQGLTAVQFICEGTTMSGIDFELVGNGYRVSLCKKRIMTGKYISEGEKIV